MTDDQNAREEQQMSNENETQTSAEVTSPISDAMADAALDVVMDDGHNGLDCRPARNLGETVRLALEAAYPAIRQQIAEEIAVAIEDAAASIYFGNRYALHEAVEVASQHAAR